MADVEIAIHGRRYRLTCEDGHEDHVRALARDVDECVAELGAEVGEAGENWLLMLAALSFADEASAARAAQPAPAPPQAPEQQEQEAATRPYGAPPPMPSGIADPKVGARTALLLERASERIEALTEMIETETQALEEEAAALERAARAD